MTSSRIHKFLLAVVMLAGLSVNAYSQTKTVVISQIYMGQFANARLKNDFIELFNQGSESVDMTGWSLQVGKGSDASWTVVPLSGTLVPGQYYLVKGATNNGAGLYDVPTGDNTLNTAMGATGGRVGISSTTEAFNGPCPNGIATLKDFFIWGAANGCGGAPDVSGIEAYVRAEGGCGSGFSLVTPYPRSSGAPRSSCGTTAADAQAAFTVPAGGGFSRVTPGTGSALTVGSGQLLGSSPNGLAIFGYRQGGNLVSEATVPATTLVRNALIYAEIDSPGNTGIAISNPNNTDVSIRFTFWNAQTGSAAQSGFLTVTANGQLARFLNELPFAIASGGKGTVELQADAPIGVIALRGLTNERGEFLVTTLPVVDLALAPSFTPAYLAHFAVEGGWRTSVYLLNNSNSAATGTIEFRDPAGQLIDVPFIGFSGNKIPYNIPPRNSMSLTTLGNGTAIKSGSIQILPTGGSATPVPVAEFSYRRNNITVSSAGLTGIVGTKFRTYVEASGTAGANGSIQSGLAIANVNATATTVDLQLVGIDGVNVAGQSITLPVPGNGQVAKFLNELFPGVPATFKGFIRASTTGAITMVGLRSRYNERGDFLITTVPPANELAPAAATTVVFPHFADSGGYTTQFVLFGANGQAGTGTLRTFNPAGRNLAITLQ